MKEEGEIERFSLSPIFTEVAALTERISICTSYHTTTVDATVKRAIAGSS